MYSARIVKERSYSCLLQLSNTMPHICTFCSVSLDWNTFRVSKRPSGISYLWTLVYYTMHQTSAALLNLQCQVLQNIHLTEIAICDSLWHRHCILFPTFDDLQSIQILTCIHPGKKHSSLGKGSTEWFIVMNSYPTAECDHQIQQSNFLSNFPSNNATELNSSNSGNLKKQSHTLSIGWHQPNSSTQIVAPEPLQPNKATLLMSTK